MIRDKSYWLCFFSLLVVVGAVYLGTQVYTIYGGDAGDLVSAIVTYGIPHPPGYPLYTTLGIILNKLIPAGTPAWRVGFLSSIPAILAIFILYDLLFYLTGKLLISAVGVAVLAFAYPFWLYSVVVEVFSLNNLLSILLLWSAIHMAREEKGRYLYLAAFILGLSLAHHHIILFLIPGLFYILASKRKMLTRKNILLSIFLFLLGLVPYFYVLVAASGNSPINWMGRATVSNFLSLVTRAAYGTFRAGAFIAEEPVLRLLDIYGFLNFAYQDFRIAGIIFFVVGFIYLAKKERKIFYLLSIGCLSYLFFLFYASFPLVENFIVGTFERFVLPLYILVTFFITFGLWGLTSFVSRYAINFLGREKKSFVLNIINVIFFIYPVGLFLLNFPKISILKYDFTAENFGKDLLETVPTESIILIGVDTPLFNSQYVYYSQKKWPKVKLIHFHKLVNPATSYQTQNIYPELFYPLKSDSPQKLFESFLAENYEKYPIFSKQPFVSKAGVWIPWGLLFRYFKNTDLPDDKFVLSENRKIWSSYADPLAGSLSKFKNLLLSDTIKFYSLAHQEIGFWAAKRGASGDAESHLLAAERLTPDDLDSYNILSQVYIQQHKCDQAKAQIDYRISKNPDDANSFLLMSLTYAVCYQDEEKALFFQKIYEEKLIKRQTPLKKL